MLIAGALMCTILLTNVPEARALDIPDFSWETVPVETSEDVVPETRAPVIDDF